MPFLAINPSPSKAMDYPVRWSKSQINWICYHMLTSVMGSNGVLAKRRPPTRGICTEMRGFARSRFLQKRTHFPANLRYLNGLWIGIIGVVLSVANVQLQTNLLLAPIAGYCDLAFRLIARSCGSVGLACTDLLCPEGVLRENYRSMVLSMTCPEDSPLCMQLYGANAERLCEAARW